MEEGEMDAVVVLSQAPILWTALALEVPNGERRRDYRGFLDQAI